MWTCILVLTSIATLGMATTNMDPRVTITETFPSDHGKYIIKGFISSDVTMTCFVEDLETARYDVKWQRSIFMNGNVHHTHISTDMDIQDNNKWSIEKPTSFSWRLRIKSLQVLDEANYTCFVQLNFDTTVSANRTVLAYELPQIIESEMSSDIMVKEGEELELMCNASGRPLPTVMWRREGNAILPNGGVINMGGKLAINEAKHADRGTYICEGINEVGKIFRRIFLEIQFAPKLDGIKEINQALGYQRTLICYVDANPQPKTDPNKLELYWTKGNRGIKPDDRIEYRTLKGAHNRLIFELIFRRVIAEDFGDYVCNAFNNLGTSATTFKLSESDVPIADKGGLISAGSVLYHQPITHIATSLAVILFAYMYSSSFQ